MEIQHLRVSIYNKDHVFPQVTFHVVSKALTMFGIVVDCCWPCFEPLCDEYTNLFLENANTGYAEVRYPYLQTV